MDKLNYLLTKYRLLCHTSFLSSWPCVDKMPIYQHTFWAFKMQIFKFWLKQFGPHLLAHTHDQCLLVRLISNCPWSLPVNDSETAFSGKLTLDWLDLLAKDCSIIYVTTWSCGVPCWNVFILLANYFDNIESIMVIIINSFQILILLSQILLIINEARFVLTQ